MNTIINFNNNIFTDYKDVVNIKDLQKMLGIGRNLAYKLINENKIEHLKNQQQNFYTKTKCN